LNPFASGLTSCRQLRRFRAALHCGSQRQHSNTPEISSHEFLRKQRDRNAQQSSPIIKMYYFYGEASISANLFPKHRN
jgi:hypothetical protein